MKIAAINSMSVGSTGRIMIEIGKQSKIDNLEYIGYCGNWVKNQPLNECVRFGFRVENFVSAILYRITGIQHVGSILGTLSLIRKLKKYNPDVIHIHNLHLWVLNVPMLFRYIKRQNIPVIWTLHDCWAFTGQCPHFTMAKCEKWKTGCHDCVQYKQYPKSYVDRTGIMWKLKKKWFTGVNNVTIVTPSQWLADLLKKSFLHEYPIRVIHNGIDLSVFKPTEKSFRTAHKLEDKYIVLGVSFGWGKSKGLDVFIELSKSLPDSYQIVLVGTNGNTDRMLPDNILSIHTTHNQIELAGIYTAADVFVNPTREENYPSVNMESLACGTPVLTFKTGGSPEILNEACGFVVDSEDVNTLQNIIIRICEEKPYSKETCIKHSKNFEAKDRFKEYLELYKEVVE
ncbi:MULTISPECIES: glycosyltransferase [Blautia]|uniref:glycosyltransferase n=1 Tax=Blautia TaxID=572511 RepID=UPI000BA3B142|nr:MULTISPECIES: glycosyltransferase [Blautia]